METDVFVIKRNEIIYNHVRKIFKSCLMIRNFSVAEVSDSMYMYTQMFMDFYLNSAWELKAAIRKKKKMLSTWIPWLVVVINK